MHTLYILTPSLRSVVTVRMSPKQLDTWCLGKDLCSTLTTLYSLFFPPLSFSPILWPPLPLLLRLQVKANSVKQEFEKQDELKRSAMRAVAALLTIPEAEKSPMMSEFQS